MLGKNIKLVQKITHAAEKKEIKHFKLYVESVVILQNLPYKCREVVSQLTKSGNIFCERQNCENKQTRNSRNPHRNPNSKNSLEKNFYTLKNFVVLEERL